LVPSAAMKQSKNILKMGLVGCPETSVNTDPRRVTSQKKDKASFTPRRKFEITGGIASRRKRGGWINRFVEECLEVGEEVTRMQ
jgi:hypothetical protein